ncbi:MAG: GNAT family N-acetyltransferase [Candidatus Zixiibacteriota bacterium]|nr:MAG: GNAT family N-acetyltransferase [candidate division Zixibacteria bacterium]
MVEIIPMTTEDTAFATDLTDIEKWGYLRRDFERLMFIEPEGCFIAWKADHRVGMVTAISYGRFAFLGCLIVIKEARGEGIGEKLMRHAVDFLKRKGVRTIELDGVFKAVPLYRRLGFRDKYLSLRFVRPPEYSHKDHPPCPENLFPEILEFDRRATGIGREKPLGAYFEDLPDHIHASGLGRLLAYAIVRPRADNLLELGPMVAESAASARVLLQSIIDKYAARPIGIGIPATNSEGVDLIISSGFHYREPALRMYLGERLEYEKHIYGIFSPEKG